MMKEHELINLLLEVISLPKESEWIEFKVNNGDPQEIGELISALSNSACYHGLKNAYLVYGVADGSHELVGTNFHPLMEKKGSQELENWIATQLDPKIDFTIHEFSYREKHFSLFQIEATRNTPVLFRGESFIRVGSYKKKLNDHPERERKIWRREDSSRFELESATQDVSSAEVLQLLDYSAYFELLGLPMAVSEEGIFSRLIQDKLIAKRGEGSFRVTNLGALLLARDIEKFDRLVRKAIRVIVYNGDNRTSTLREQEGRRGYANGFEGLVRYISEQVPHREVIDGALRKHIADYPIIALRELVANALIHQDFTVGGASPMVEIFTNRIEITNPGKALIEAMRFVDHSPESRNELLARMMRRLSICEERGSGMDKVILACEEHQLPSPEIIVGDNFTRIILFGPRAFRDLDKAEKIRACYYHACLKYVSGQFMTNQSLRERFGIEDHNSAIASRIISDTIERGWVRDSDPHNKSRKHIKYVPFWV
jgi:predicted HTH transcriptional regulator